MGLPGPGRLARRVGPAADPAARVGQGLLQLLVHAGLGEVDGAAVGGGGAGQVLEHAPDLVVEPFLHGPAGRVPPRRPRGGFPGGRGRGRRGRGRGGATDPPPAAHARAWLEAAPDASADVLVADVFGGSRVPAHLTSVAYAREAARVLRADGVYLGNLADAAPFAFLRSQLATLGTVFEELVLIAEPGVLRGRRFGNAVLAAAHRPLDIAALARRTAADAFPARVEHGAALRDFTGGARPVRDADAVPSPEPPDGAFGIG
ncbi:spermidine synthase [Streptomyces prasinus]|uniref:spermidine synthase n=1 Tax=Streptomyces prasinus TaxID=67345 RepID=UPI00363AC1A5